MPDGRPAALAASALLAAAAILAVLAAAQPYALAGLGVVLLGPLHVLLALRYLAGRAWPALAGPAGQVLVLALAGMVAVRAVGVLDAHLGHRLELLGGTLIVGYACWVGVSGGLRWVSLAVVAGLAALSAVDLPWYWHLFVHGHNVVPLIFLWDWARRWRTGARWGFVGANLLWLVGVPALVLAGSVDGHLNPVPPGLVSRLTDPASLLAAAAPPGDQTTALRFLVVFAFLQGMHYVIWIVFFQVCGRPEVARVARALPALAGWRFWALAALVSAVVWSAYAVSYRDGRAVYGVLGGLNVYLEQPVAVWLLLTALPASATSALVGKLRDS